MVEAFSNQLAARVKTEIEEGHAYEALQYVQSFIARKKKALTPESASSLIFLGASLLAEAKASEDVGALLLWFIETGAGEDLRFKIRSSVTESSCDLENLLKLLLKMTPSEYSSVIEKVYQPIGKLVSALSTRDTNLSQIINQNMLKFEEYSSKGFASSGNYLSALKCACRVGDMNAVAKILHEWASHGYKYEYPLFFARAVLHLLAEDHSDQAFELVGIGRTFINEADYLDVTNDNFPCPSLVTWHLCIITVELNSLSSVPLQTKRNIYEVLCNRYNPLLGLIDNKLPHLLNIIGNVIFPAELVNDMGSSSSRNNGMLDMIQGLLGGGAPGGIDLKGMLGVLQGAGGAPRMR